ncbi:MAG: hypothetical protein RLZZ312_1506 [Bacteroidota bacterium]|jgi:hypothetical protein
MSRYFFSCLFCFVIVNIFAQKAVKKDSVVAKNVPQRYGVRFGVDLYKATRGFYDKNYTGLELVGDYRLTKKIFLAAELGNENKTVQEDNLNFTTKGSYIKAGFDYNLHENWLDLENMIYVGLRYGVATFSQNLNTYKIYNSSPYFGQSQVVQSDLKSDGRSAQWAEVVAGIKTRVFNNVFVGFSVRGNILVSNAKPVGFDNLYIPGYNRTYDGSFGVGFNYTVSYLLPLYKSKPQLFRKNINKSVLPINKSSKK